MMYIIDQSLFEIMIILGVTQLGPNEEKFLIQTGLLNIQQKFLLYIQMNHNQINEQLKINHQEHGLS